MRSSTCGAVPDCSARRSAVWETSYWKRFTRLQNKEKTVLETRHAQAAELHTNAAYAHAAAGCEHSSGDHLSSQDLARLAYDRSQEAARVSRAIAKESIAPMQV